MENNTINISVDEQALSVVEAVAKKVTPCVVGIRTTTSVNSFFGNQQEASGEGSGVIYKQDGYITMWLKMLLSIRAIQKLKFF